MRRMVPGSAGVDHRMPRRNLRRARGQRAPSRLLFAAAHIGRKPHFEREHHVDERLEGDADEQIAAAKQRLDTEMAAFRQTMKVQSGIVENVRGDAAALSEIVAKSQGAEGSLAADWKSTRMNSRQ